MVRVSIIIPCLNEEKTIGLLLAAIYAQTWARTELEVILADGGSRDRTLERVAEFSRDHPDLSVRLVENPQRIIPAALNRALDQAGGEFIVRLDAHSQPEPDYIERCITDLSEGRGEMVGGVWLIRPQGRGWMARSIAAGAAHPLGVGDALYRYATEARLVDTVPFGAYRRELLERVGRYDETLLANEDYEFNTRVHQAGGRIYLDPAIRSVYFARPNLVALARQYARYGFWKFRMLQRYPNTLRWRQALPPLFVTSLLFWIVLTPFWLLAGWLLGLEVWGYLLLLVLGALPVARRERDSVLIVGIPLAIITMHCSWGLGFLGSMVKSVFNRLRGNPK